MLVCSITGDINLDPLSQVVSAKFFYCSYDDKFCKMWFWHLRDDNTFFFSALLND